MAGVASIEIRGNVTPAVEALRALGYAAEETAAKTDEAFGDKLAGSVERTGGVFGKLGSIVSGLGLPFGETFTKMGEHIEGADTEGKKIGATLAEVGKIATVAGVAGFAVIAAESLHLGENFQKSTSQLAANAGIPMKAATAIGTAFLDTAGKTTFSGQAIMDAYSGVAGQLGTVEGHALSSKQAMNVMSAAMDLAEASGSNLTSTTSSLASVMQAFQIPVTGAAQASDVLFNTATKTGNSVEQVATTVARLHMRLGNMTPDLGSVGGLMLTLAQNGVSGTRGMTTMSTALEKLLSGTKPVTAELKFLGINLYNAHGQFVGLGPIMDQLGEKMANMTQQQEIQATTTLFGANASSVMGRVLSYGSLQFNENTRAVLKSGEAHAAAEKQAHTLHGEMEMMKSTVEDLGAKFGLLLIPIINRLSTVIAGVIGWFDRHRMVAEVLAGVIGGVLVVAVAAYVVSMAAAAVATIAATWPLLAIIAVLAAVGVGVYELATHWKQIWNDILNFMRRWWPEILGVATGGIGLLIGLIVQHFNQIAQFFNALWQGVDRDTRNWWGDIERFFEGIGSSIVGFFSGSLPQFFDNLWSGIVRDAAAWFTVLVVWFQGLPRAVMSAVWGLLTDMYNFGQDIINAIVNGIGSMGSAIWNAIKSGVSGAGGIVGKALGVIGLASGGLVTQPTLAVVGESGPEWVIPAIGGVSTDGSGVVLGAQPGGGGAGQMSIAVQLQLDGRVLGQQVWPYVRTAALQTTGRNAKGVGLGGT